MQNTVAHHKQKRPGLSPDALYYYLIDDLEEAQPGIINQTEPWPDITPRQYAALALKGSILKKFTDKIHKDAEQRALDKFLSVNERCGNWSLVLGNAWDEVLVGELKCSIDRFLHPKGNLLFDSYYCILDSGRLGPGASVGVRGNDFYTKMFSSRLTTTDRHLYVMYKAYVKLIPEWANAEVIRQAHFGDACIVRGSRTSFVPKTNDISRTICTEPSLNMFFQLGLGKILEGRLKAHFDVDLSTQPDLNRELAYEGSLDGRYSTIDLSSASDSLSMRMLASFLPEWFLTTLRELRSPVTTCGNSREIELGMVSTMGNGFTFPLQTMLFSCVVDACYRSRGVVPNKNDATDGRAWAVFGDDIIVPRVITRDVLRLLNILGFEVNASKTFVEGQFRESCGSDYYQGFNVRGVYIKTLSEVQDRFVAINSLVDWSARTGISLRRTIQVLLKTVPWMPVPRFSNAETGLRVPSSLVSPKYDRNGSFLYKRLEPRACRVRIGDGWISAQQGVKREYNPSGLLLSFLRGDIVSGMITVRHDSGRFRAKLACTPSWDTSPPMSKLSRDDLLRRERCWESTAYYLIR